MRIPFDRLPGYNELFLDYINDYSSLSRFFEYDYHSDESFLHRSENVLDAFPGSADFGRSELAGILLGQNEEFGSGKRTSGNISLLKEHNTLAVVTGQQLGILGGPLYTLVKALNTVQLCKRLSSTFPQFNFVPVFWMEGDDHDFEEVNNVTVIDRQNELRKFTYLEGGVEHEKYVRPVGQIIFDKGIDELSAGLRESLGATDFTEELFSAVTRNYRPGNSFRNSFAGFLNYATGDSGLVLLDPTDPQVKSLLRPVFRKALLSAPELAERLIETTVELESSHIAQVKPKPVNLFYIHDGSRHLIEPREGGTYALKNTRQRFSREELLEKLDSGPGNFSWNVITRPLCQDHLLPVVAYIGGPSEISYFAQLKEAYSMFGMKMPVIYPRVSVTISDGRTANFMSKNSVGFSELFDEKELIRNLLRKSSDTDPDEIFSKMKDELNGIFYTYEKTLSGIDANQTAAFQKRASQFIDSLEVMKEKFGNALAGKSQVLTGQIGKIVQYVYPGSIMQERMLNVTMFMNKYGHSFTESLMDQMDVELFEHQVIDPSPKQQ